MGNLPAMTDFDAIRTLMPQLVPAVATLGIEYDALDATHAVCALRDDPALHNHVGGLHAGLIFTLAETASGALVMGNFDELIRTGVIPLAASAEIRWTKLAKGRVSATATLGRDADAIRAELEQTGKTVQFPVEVVMTTADGETSRMTISWALRPPR
jgi:acyl-coenzyme A thioesterase PaaI-like protein